MRFRPGRSQVGRRSWLRDCILVGVQITTTVRVMKTTRDAVRSLADADGLTLDGEIERLARAERQRRIGAALRAAPGDDEQSWLDMAAATVGGDARR